jgi:hypothetical protein
MSDVVMRSDVGTLSRGHADRVAIPKTKCADGSTHISNQSRWVNRILSTVRPFPNGDDQWKISLAGGELPRWRGDGKELFFLGADGKMRAVAVEAALGANPSFKPEVPKPLFEARLARVGTAVVFQYDVTADGKRFLLDTTGGSTASMQMLNVIVNWTSSPKK